MPDYDYEPVYPRSNGGKAKMVMALCCLCCGLFFLFGAEGIAWARSSKLQYGAGGSRDFLTCCDSSQRQQPKCKKVLWHPGYGTKWMSHNENATSTPMIGYWSNLDLFLGLLQPLGLSEKLEEGGSRSSWRNPSESWEIILNHSSFCCSIMYRYRCV